MKPPVLGALCSLLLPLAAATNAASAVVVYEKDASRVSLSASVQMRYERVDPSGASATDAIAFRRLRSEIEGSTIPDWTVKVDIDFGKASATDEVSVRDAYLRYRGVRNLDLFVGNSKTPFARKFLYSWKELQSTDWGFLGDHNLGVPERQMGVRADARLAGGKTLLSAAAGFEGHDPDARNLDFDSPANPEKDWNEGRLAALRAEFFPRGTPRSGQGDFHTEKLLPGLSFSGFLWRDDHDVDSYSGAGAATPATPTADLDRAWGLEVSGALRGHGFSADAGYQRIHAESVARAFTGGIYRDGSATIDKVGVQTGVMLAGNRFEPVGEWEMLDTAAYDDPWTATEIGINVHRGGHAPKGQVAWRWERAIRGVKGADCSTFVLQILESF